MKQRSWLLCTLSLVGILACEREGAFDSGGPLRVTVDSTDDGVVSLALHGLSGAELASLRDEQRAEGNPAMRVFTGDGESTPMLGAYEWVDGRLIFEPSFPFEAGRAYTVRGTFGDSATGTRTIDTTIVPLAARAAGVRTVVSRLLPSADTLPENLLRIYVEFSAPMSRVGGLPYLTLLDDRNHAVSDAFLPLDADFWSRDRRRYTVFLDPGRVKQGIRPNEEMGRALRAGRRYTIVVDSLWPDEHGRPLGASFRKSFQVGDAVGRAIDTNAWRYTIPPAGSRQPLVLRFAAPLDHGLMPRSLGIETAAGTALAGESSVGANERSWEFVPAVPWQAGDYRLLVLTILEDVAGNRIDRPFEVDNFDRVDSSGTVDRRHFPIRIR